MGGWVVTGDAGKGPPWRVVQAAAVGWGHSSSSRSTVCCVALPQHPAAPSSRTFALSPGSLAPFLQFADRLFKCLVSFLLDVEDDPEWHTAEDERNEHEGEPGDEWG